MFQTSEVDVAVEDLVLCFTDEDGPLHGSVPIEESIRALLELLRADFLRTNPLWDDEAASGNFPESLGENLRADDVPLDDVHVVVRREGLVHRAWIHVLGRFEEQSVFIEGHLDDRDAGLLGQSRHEVAKRSVEPASSAGRDEVGRMRAADDLLNKDTVLVGDLEGREDVFFKVARDDFRRIATDGLGLSEHRARVDFAS